MSLQDLLPTNAEARAALLLSILARCVDDGGCQRWLRGVNGDGHPMMRLAGTVVPVRRVVHQLVNGPLAPGERAVCTCECRRCVEPTHMQAMAHGRMMRLRAQEGRMRSPMRAAKSAARMRAASRWTDADIAAVRATAGTGTLAERAAPFGMSPTYLSALDRGHWRRPVANPWAGMGQRTTLRGTSS